MRLFYLISSLHHQQWRYFWRKLHLYLGLSIGLIFVLAGLTGSLLVFYVEIDEFISPELHISTSPTNKAQSFETILQTLNANHPTRTKGWRIEIPRHANAPLMARYYKPEETEHLHFAPLITWINPYTAEILSNRIWGQYLMTWIYDLHYSLLLDLNGKTIMAGIGGLLLFSLGSGVYLWWPARGKFKTALSIKPRASNARLNYDLHKVNGIYSLPFMLLLILSGILLELPDFFNPGINRLSPLYTAKANISTYQTKATRISVDQAVVVAQQQFPNAMLRWIETPKDINGSYRIIFYQPGEPSKRFPKSIVWIDQYSAKVLETHNPMFNRNGDSFLSWLHPLHSGEILGLTGRWLVLILGIIPIILYFTGMIRWWQKQQVGK